jgi:hypothetical protein
MSPQNQQHGQYDFIMGAGQQAKKPRVALPEPNSQGQRIAIFAGIIILVFIFIFFLMWLMGRGGEDKALYTKISQEQAEIVRIATLATSEASAGQSVKNVAVNTQSTLSSDQKALVATIAKKGIKLKGKDLKSVPNKSINTRLTEATAAANFDSTMLAILDEQLTGYRSTLEQTYDKTNSKSIKETLTKAYDHTELLQKQLAATNP